MSGAIPPPHMYPHSMHMNNFTSSFYLQSWAELHCSGWLARQEDNSPLNNPCSRGPLEKLIVSQVVKKFRAYYGTHRFITASTAATTCPCPESHQSNPCPSAIYWRSILILSFHLCLGLASGLFSFAFSHQNAVCNSPLPPQVPHTSPTSVFFILLPR
jgi:hypothetical protein